MKLPKQIVLWEEKDGDTTYLAVANKPEDVSDDIDIVGMYELKSMHKIKRTVEIFPLKKL